MNKTPHSVLKKSLISIAPYYRNAMLFGFFTNLMLLAPSWYMLEVYDRVINSRNTTTLAMLTLLVVFIYVVMECLEWARKKLIVQASLKFESQLNQTIFDAAFLAKLKAFNFPIQQVFTDFKTLKESLYSPALIGLMDVPFCLIFIVALFFIHPVLGFFTLAALAIQVVMILMNQTRIYKQMKLANQFAFEAQNYFTTVTNKAEVVKSMGMLQAIGQRWQGKQQAFLFHQSQASEIASKSAASSKFLQTMQTSLVLGLGCYLVINNALPYGGAMMIIASILAARVFSPFVQLVSQWRVLADAQEAYGRLENLLSNFSDIKVGMALPPPTGDISVESLSYAVPVEGRQNAELFLKNIQFKLNAGNVLIIAGPSASGKTTLSKLLVGLHQPSSGNVRFNGVDAYKWNKAELGEYIGYLPQSIELINGTLAENIARFNEVDNQKLNHVIELLNLHDLIADLPEGVNTQIGQDGAFLSGGRRQLIGLARAIYGNPKIIILDEPNANLDEASDKALQAMITSLKTQGATFIIISHLQHILHLADFLMIMMNGQMFRYGKPAEVMASLQPTQTQAAPKQAASAQAGSNQADLAQTSKAEVQAA
ncbi:MULTISPECIES: type I secretion system permease/ATPase [Methylotenera]|uniref:type I secretion system permease/ATPase n=1 Tax=Methylotenera TaxID=359407 RepID=UPI00036CDB65|nr:MULTISPECIES: type I secretion system permease/ATPase [Methylotenera]